MAISMSRKKTRPSKEVERKKLCWVVSLLLKCLYRVPAVVMFLGLIFLWSSSTTMISGNIVHLCVSSRKLNDLFCVSAGHGANPNFEIPIPIGNGSFSGDSEARDESVDAVEASPSFGTPIGSPNGGFSGGLEVGNGSVGVVAITSLNGGFSGGLEVGNGSVGDVKASPNLEIPIISLNGRFSSKNEVGNGSVDGVKATPDFEIPSPSLNGSFSSNLEVRNGSVDDVKATRDFEIPIISLNESFSSNPEARNGSVNDVKATRNFEIPIISLNESFLSNPEAMNGGVDDVKASPNSKIPITSLNGSFSSNPEVRNGSVDDVKASPNSKIPITSLNGSFSSNPEVRNGSVDDVKPTPDFETLTPSLNGGIRENHELENESVYALMDVKEQLKAHRSWISKDFSNQECDGRGIYVYDLPSKFNKDLLGQCRGMLPWMDFCKYLSNEALGEAMPGLGEEWYQTHQYSLEPILHSRFLKHRCRVYDPSEAKIFYVPFYGGFDILRWHFMNVSLDVKDSLGLELLAWLRSKPSWARNSGKDHVFVLGKISWDFRRHPGFSWGTRFLDMKEMQNPIKLLIERHPWHENDIGIPHPTHFHPRSDNSIVAWQRKVISSYRTSLTSFAGAARPGDPDSIRSTLIRQCTSTQPEKCRFLDCNSGKCRQPESIIDLFMKSEFCLQPPGDSPTRKSIFDSLVSGCIPVIFDPFSAYYQYPWHLPEDHGKYSVFIDKKEVKDMKINVVERLMKISIKERDDMRRYIVYQLLPGLVYSDPNSKLDKFHDAFDITINNLFERVNRLML